MFRCLHPALAVLILAGTACPSAHGDSREFDQRLHALGLSREELPSARNPLLTLHPLFTGFLERTREDFQTDLQRVPRFTDYQLEPTTLVLCRRLQERTLEVLAGPPGQVPFDLNPVPSGFNVFQFYQFTRANSALAGEALDRNDPAAAAGHLTHNFKAADFILRSEPTAIPYSYATIIMRNTVEEFCELHRRAPDPRWLQQAATLVQKYPYRKDLLRSALLAEFHYNLALYRQMRKWLRGNIRDYGTFWDLMSIEPLKSCTSKQLLAMRFDLEASLAQLLEDLQTSLAWVESGKPLSAHPDLQRPRPEPRTLAEYQASPNGLFEILEDCSEPGPALVVLYNYQLQEAFMLASLAWLRAEADGVELHSLRDLVPKYLPAVPTDPFDGKPLRCLPGERVLYSVGSDFKDEQGRSGDPDLEFSPHHLEPAYRIPALR